MPQLTKSAQQLKILPHRVLSHKGEEVEIFSSIECKGIKGNDGRHYILDLLRTFPPDVNFLPSEWPSYLPPSATPLGEPHVWAPQDKSWRFGIQGTPSCEFAVTPLSSPPGMQLLFSSAGPNFMLPLSTETH